MGRFIVTKDGHNISDYDTIGEAITHRYEIDGEIGIDTDEKYDHCTNCKDFYCSDVDYCCLHDMKILCKCKDGKFYSKLPESCDNCPNYEWNEGYGNGDLYYVEYQKFLKTL